MNERSSAAYAVIVSDAKAWKPTAAAQALAAWRNVPVQDAAADAKASAGILQENADEAMARKMAEHFSTHGLPAFAVPGDSLNDPPPAEPIAKVIFNEDGFTAEMKANESFKILWHQITVLAASAIVEKIVRTTAVQQGPDLKQKALKMGIGLATGLPIGFGSGKSETVKKEVETTDLIYYLDVIGAGRRLRVDYRRFDYTGLKERKEFSAVLNFRRLLEELVKRAPKALLGPGTTILLDSGPARDMSLASLSELDRQCRWLLALKIYADRTSQP